MIFLIWKKKYWKLRFFFFQEVVKEKHRKDVDEIKLRANMVIKNKTKYYRLYRMTHKLLFKKGTLKSLHQ